tara:strand:- start:62 stop:490 length:429 start_codon:yes stop_codon:yes gene_type:complete
MEVVMKKIKQLGGLKMRKAFAIAFILFMFASTTTALAGNKRFCGFVATSDANSIGAGVWFRKHASEKSNCYRIRQEIKQTLQDKGLWEGNTWHPKKPNKCGNVSNFFTNGANMCGKPGYMENARTPYLIKKIGRQPTTFEEL